MQTRKYYYSVRIKCVITITFGYVGIDIISGDRLTWSRPWANGIEIIVHVHALLVLGCFKTLLIPVHLNIN